MLFVYSVINTYSLELAWNHKQGVVIKVSATWGHLSLIKKIQKDVGDMNVIAL